MNVENRTLFIADNLDIMRGMNSNTVDLIYLDPPFNTNEQYKAPIGSPAEGAEFKDIWTDEDVKNEWYGQIASEHEELYQIIQASETVYDASMKIYLTAMAVRLFEMRRILKPAGSIYLHCDSTANAPLRIVMDTLFGKQNFRREITWSNEDSSGFKSRANNWIRSGETIFYYVKSKQYTYNKQYLPRADATLKRHNKVDEDGRRYKVYRNEDGSERRSYLNLRKGVGMRNVWTDIPSFQKINKRKKDQSREYTGYPTQKPLKLLDRIIKASSDEGDTVLDPFCGCATACVAAERLHRHWVGIDISPSAEDITKLRFTEEVDEASNSFNPLTDVIVRKDPPKRTDDTEEKTVQMSLPTYQTHKPVLFGRQQGRCNGCEYEFHYRNLTVDHISPQSKGVDDRIENLQLLCASCNSIKGTGTHEELIQKLIDRKIRKVDGSTP